MRGLSNGQCALGSEPIRLAADRQFGRYKPESSQEVRKPNVTGQSYAEQVKRTREMLRSMDPEKVKQVIEFRQDLNFFQALALAQREGKLIVPNDIHDRILTETKDEQYLRQNYSVRTGTLVIYEKPDKKLGKEVVYSWKDIYTKVNYSISFSVPEQFQGLVNCALIVEHPDFEIRRLRVRKNPKDLLNRANRILKDLPEGQTDLGNNNYEIKPLGEIRLIENFPTHSQRWWYNIGPETKIPIGKPVKESKDARYLWRLDRAYIGSVGRGVDDLDIDDRRRYVYAVDDWSYGSGVAFVQLASSEA